MQILTFTTLYPSAQQPQHGIFVETRLRKLVEDGGVKARVLAPCPWFPFAAARFGRYAAFARIPSQETRHGLHIDHPSLSGGAQNRDERGAPSAFRRHAAVAAPAASQRAGI